MGPSLPELFLQVRRKALHLETRDAYGGSAAFDAWMTGTTYDRRPSDEAWHRLVRPLVERDVDFRRARIVSEPVSDYIRFEYEVTPVANLAAGEQVRWLSRRRCSDLAVPANDYWLLDDSVVFLHFAGNGDFEDTELISTPDVVEFCNNAFEAVWARAIPHQQFELR